MSPSALAKQLSTSSPDQAAEWFRAHSFVVAILEGTGDRRPLLVSDHVDELRRVERGYGKAKKPEDYLAEFTRFIQENLNTLPALMVVAQRPKDLTRKELRELALALDNAGFSETNLQVAWRDKTNQDIAATILGFIRQAALGDPLVPYEQRVDRAVERILARQAWTKPQRTWLDRIAKQLKKEKIVDRASLDEGQFAVSGGFDRLNKTFDGQLEAILSELGASIWQDSA
jgi:type I restriction enzyme R subunit